MNNSRKQFDYLYLILTIILMVGGIILVFDSSFARAADRKSGDVWYYVKLQVGYALVGVLALYGASTRHPKAFRPLTRAFLYVSIVLLALVQVHGIGKSIAGSARWIPLGPFHLQPSEVAKLAVVMYLANEFASKGLKIRNPKQLWKSLWPVAAVLALVVKEDLGTTMIVALSAGVMLFVAGAKKRHLLSLAGIGVLGAVVMTYAEEYRQARILTWLNPLKYYNGGGYQISHALFGLASGGIRGLGFGEGREKFYIPAPQTDMIAVTWGEEAGLIGMLILLGLFVWLMFRGFSIAHKAKSPYMHLLALGVTSMITLQALVNIAVLMGLIPATGVPLPFISYGGSHLIIMLTGIGMVLSVSRHIDEKMDEPEQGEYEGRRHRRRDGGPYISGSKYRPSPKGNRN